MRAEAAMLVEMAEEREGEAKQAADMQKAAAEKAAQGIGAVAHKPKASMIVAVTRGVVCALVMTAVRPLVSVAVAGWCQGFG